MVRLVDGKAFHTLEILERVIMTGKKGAAGERQGVIDPALRRLNQPEF